MARRKMILQPLYSCSFWVCVCADKMRLTDRLLYPSEAMNPSISCFSEYARS